MPSGRKLHRFLVSHRPVFNDLETPSAFFILNRLTFSGTSESGEYSEQAPRKKFTEGSIQRLRQVSAVIQGTKITNEDFERVVMATRQNVFIFLDPPYYSAIRSALYGRKAKLRDRTQEIALELEGAEISDEDRKGTNRI